MLLILDNYDSFTYNLFHYCEMIMPEERIVVKRNDEIELNEIEEFDKIIISPGPGLPKEAGITMELLERYAETKKILGVCLGLQAMVEHFGGSLKNLDEVIHGRSTTCHLEKEDSLFDGIPNSFKIGHYHSWVADEKTLPNVLNVTARNENGLIMALSHQTLNVKAIQFHPESILTEYGMKMIENWLT